MSELTKRVLFALAAAPVFIGLVFLGGYYFLALMLLISLITTWEMVNLFRAAQVSTDYWPAYLLSLSWMTMPLHPFGSTFVILSILIIIVKETLTPPHGRYLSILSTLFAAIYPAWGFLSFFEIRTWESDSVGLILVLVVLIMIWGNDSFAYFFGKNFGKHKMAPEISPAKTWEGFGGGFLGAILVLSVFIYFADLPYSISLLIPLAVIVSVFGPIGDISESKIKRFAGKKDSSNLLPGHGGFFDRFDSIILVSPVVILYFKFIQLILN